MGTRVFTSPPTDEIRYPSPWQPIGGAPSYESPMSSFAVPPAAVLAEIPHRVPFQIVSPSAEPPDGKGWLHEIKHDGHRLLAIVADGSVKLVSRNGYDRTELFAAPFRALV